MENNKKTKQKLASEICEQYPNTSTAQICKMLQKKYPCRFTDYELTRNVVRVVRGACGNKSRKYATAQTPEWCLRMAGNLPPMPEPLQYDRTPKYVDVKERKVLILSDIHCPFHNVEALTAALDYGQKKEANAIILNGDFLDFINISSFVRDEDIVDTSGELQKARGLLAHIKGRFPTAKIYYKLGNHEDRFQRYMATHAPELLGVETFTLDNMLKLSESGIKTVETRTIIQIGRKLNVVHGHEFRSGMFGNPVNPARTLFLKTKGCSICGHWHTTSKHSEKNINDTIIATWSSGCLCDLRPTYAPVNNWNHGFVFVEVVDDDDNFIVENKEIIKGKVY